MPVILITGGAKRLGRAIVESRARAGDSIALHVNHSIDEAHELANDLNNQGFRVCVFQADLLKPQNVQKLFFDVLNTFGCIDILINNASTFVYDDIDNATQEMWDYHFQVNAHAPFFLSQLFFNHLSSDKDGCIINIIDERVLNLTPYFMTYTLSKSVLWTMTQTMALAMAPRVRVNAIGPGPTIKGIKQTEAHFKSQCDKMPLKRGVSVNDICLTVDYLINNQSLTGQLITVDCGHHLAWAFPDNPLKRIEI